MQLNDSSDDPLDNTQQTLAGIFITNLRIYDTLMAILLCTDEEVYNRLYAKHAAGGILTPPPMLDPGEMPE